ncbi:MAG: endo alpha-1,4 polygalactosaminidase [Phycisphaerae bacterium]
MPHARFRCHLFVALLAPVVLTGCPVPDVREDGPADRDYRRAMRDFVELISATARQRDADFIIIPQNGHQLLAAGDGTAALPAASYLAAIDGVGREDLFYGYESDDAPTPAAARNEILPYLAIARNAGKAVLVTDYCARRAFVDDSHVQNAALGHLSFAADRRELDNVPTYPAAPPNANAADVATLSGARNFLYLLNPGAFASREAYLRALAGTPHDALVIDAYFDGELLTNAEVATLKTRATGARRLVIAYMSIGEAEDYRDYWQPAWRTEPPPFVVAENANFAGNFVVRYWDAEWRQIIVGADGYLDRLLDAGFDGAYLDIIDAFEFFESAAER